MPGHHSHSYTRIGEMWAAALFVAVLGTSSYTYAKASLSQGLADWIEAHRHAFELMGDVPEIVVPDNLKPGVTKVCRYEPSVNRTLRMPRSSLNSLARRVPIKRASCL